MRIALVSPYSWTYPGGVTRHIEALAEELRAAGHDARILAPFDPDDALARVMHRGARPQPMRLPEGLVALGRSTGLPANGAISNLAATPDALVALARELRGGAYDLVHIHEPVVPLVGWYAPDCAGDIPLVGTFHSFSENALTNGIGVLLGARRHLNRLHARIAVSEAAAWTARRFFGGRYRIVPNGVHLGPTDVGLPAGSDLDPLAAGGGDRNGDARSGVADWERAGADRDGMPALLRILFVGQAVERKGLPVLLRAFEALREHVPATLTLVGAGPEDVAPLLLDDRGVRALGKVSEAREGRRARARRCALRALARRGELRDGPHRGVRRGHARGGVGHRRLPRRGARRPRRPAHPPRRRARARGGAARAGARPRPARADGGGRARARRALRLASRRRRGARGLRAGARGWARSHGPAPRLAVRHGLAPADLLPHVPARRLPSLEPQLVLPAPRRALRASAAARCAAVSLAGLALALIALSRIGVGRVLASLVASSPGLVAAGLAVMCISMVARGLAWHAILSAAPTWRRARRRDALQGTFIGVLMSATLPARLGEPSRALIVARRLGRPRETLPVVLGTMVSQTLLNLLALALLGAAMLSGVPLLHGHDGALLAAALVPLAALAHRAARPRAAAPLRDLPLRAAALAGARAAPLAAARARGPARLSPTPPRGGGHDGAALRLGASVRLLLAAADGARSRPPRRDRRRRGGAVRGQRHRRRARHPRQRRRLPGRLRRVLAGAYHVSTPDAVAYGIILQAVEVATAVIMGMPALVKEGLSWKEVRLRTMHATPVRLPPLPAGGGATSRA